MTMIPLNMTTPLPAYLTASGSEKWGWTVDMWATGLDVRITTLGTLAPCSQVKCAIGGGAHIEYPSLPDRHYSLEDACFALYEVYHTHLP